MIAIAIAMLLCALIWAAVRLLERFGIYAVLFVAVAGGLAWWSYVGLDHPWLNEILAGGTW